MAAALILSSEEHAVLARDAGLHPALVESLIRLGVLDQAEPLAHADAAARLAQCVRLRRDLGLNYAGAILACQLLARIDQLEARSRRYER
jgi:hypothetical protein